MQTIQYSYNIRDWFTSINLNAQGNPVPNVSEGDLFSMKMNYASVGRYDGTMGSQAWAHHNEELQQRSYTFSYDAASRIKGATYSGVNGENYSVSDLRYDKNGNIKRLKRMGKKGSGFAQIDDLSYTYLGNHLMRVEDAVSGDNEVDFVNRNSGTDDYAYYADGCLQKDLNENISNIDYDTYLNKPVLVTLSTGETIKYIYDGTGTMIRRELSDGTFWDYLGGMILKDGKPYQIAMAEGRIVYEDTVPRHEYEYRDQAGNLRVSFTERNGKLQQTFAAGYSPFGVQIHAEVNTPAPCKFTFQGHEDIGDYGLRMFGMGARCYNQTIGRFSGVDPLADAPHLVSWSPYHMSFNNPLRFVDPDGRSPDDIILRGSNNSSVTIVTDLIDIELDASSFIGDLGGNYTLEGGDIIDAALDIGGLVDPTGAVDATATIYHAGEGNIGSTIVSGLSVLPGGDVVKVAKAGKHAKTLKKAVQTVRSSKKQVRTNKKTSTKKHFVQHSSKKKAQEASGQPKKAKSEIHDKKTGRGQRRHFHDVKDANVHHTYGKTKNKKRN